jgi:hypothetical protein
LAAWFSIERHAAHARPAHRLADRHRIGGIGLLPPDERLHVDRRDQHNPMPQRLELTRPVMRGTACLHADGHGWQSREIVEKLASADRAFVDLHPSGIDRVNLKHVLRQIEANAGDSRKIGC